jgi:hypothetical protein
MTAISTLPKQEQRAAKTQGTTALTIGLATASARGLPRLAPRPGPGLQRRRRLLGDRAWSKGMTAISTLPKQEQRAAKTQGTTALTIGLATDSARGLPRLAPRPGPGLQRRRRLLGDRAWSKGMAAISTLPKQEQRAA